MVMEYTSMFEKLEINIQAAVLVSLVDLIIEDIKQSKGYPTAVEAIRKCAGWIEKKNILADDLYDYLENIEETGVLTYLLLEKDQDRERVWICVGNALAYTTWAAYEFENQKYRPETIDCVDDETIINFIDNFKLAYSCPQILDDLLVYLCENSNIEYNNVKRFINNRTRGGSLS